VPPVVEIVSKPLGQPTICFGFGVGQPNA